METADVRRRVVETIERARRSAAERRVRTDEAGRAFGAFLEEKAVPLVRQIAGALRAAGYPFGVSTPEGAVRMTSEKTGQDYIEIVLDTSGDEPAVVTHVSRARGRRVIETERPVGTGPVATLTEAQLLESLMTELAPFVER